MFTEVTEIIIHTISTDACQCECICGMERVFFPDLP